MSRHRTLPQPDAVPPWARIGLYVVAIVAPFAGLALGRISGEQATAAVVTLFGVIGPAVAVAYERKAADEQGAHYRQGYAAAVSEHVAPLVESPQAGEQAGEHSTSGNAPEPLEDSHKDRTTP